MPARHYFRESTKGRLQMNTWREVKLHEGPGGAHWWATVNPQQYQGSLMGERSDGKRFNVTMWADADRMGDEEYVKSVVDEARGSLNTLLN
jgi:hypothetical protein